MAAHPKVGFRIQTIQAIPEELEWKARGFARHKKRGVGDTGGKGPREQDFSHAEDLSGRYGLSWAYRADYSQQRRTGNRSAWALM